jgi:hypothetical protein
VETEEWLFVDLFTSFAGDVVLVWRDGKFLFASKVA